MAHFSAKLLLHNSMRETCMNKMQYFNKPLIESLKLNSAAMLVPICVANGKVSLLYVLRDPGYRRRLTFPFGKCEKYEVPAATALKETTKLTGIYAQKIDVWGPGPPFTEGDYLVTPIIGCIKHLKRSDVKACEKYVKEVLSVSLETLCDSDNQYNTRLPNGFQVPMYSVEGYKILGMSAYFTHILLQCILPPDVYKNDWTKKRIIMLD